MMRDNIPEGDHIVRYVKSSMIQDDETADGSDFRLRPTRPDETGLSVNWLEAFKSGKRNQLDEVRRLFRLRRQPNGPDCVKSRRQPAKWLQVPYGGW